MENVNVKNNEPVNQQTNVLLNVISRRQLLDEHIASIKAAYEKAGEAYLDIGYSLYDIKRLKLYKEDGFKNIETFAQNTFDIQKTSTYNHIKVVETLGDIKDDGSCTELKPEYRSYSVSKLRLLTKVDEETRKQISSKWTYNAIDKFIKDKLANTKTEKTESKEIETKDNETENSESNSIDDILIPSEIENVIVPDSVSEAESYSFTTSKERLSELPQILTNKLTELSFTSDFTKRDILFLIHIE